MATAILGNPQLFSDDTVIYGSAASTTIITKGDWVQFSGGTVVGLGTQATPAFLTSGIGVALDNNPVYDDLGRSRNNSALAILTHGVMRVSGGSAISFTGATVTLGMSVYPATTASGIVGATGATGLGPIWLSCPKISLSGSASATVAVASGVGKLINIAKIGDITATQWDVMFDARMLTVNYY